MSGLKESLRNWLRDSRVREVIMWCLPALIVGFLLRTALLVALPYGYCTVDTPDFLGTPYKLIYKHQFRIHGKKTFLQPIVYSVPFFIGVPALIAIPVFQHLCGLVMILLIGGVCRFWFTHWKWFIVPLTLVAAVNPSLLWYEHTLMAEALYVFCMVLLVFAASVFALRRSWHAFAFLCVALFLTAGSRPEGKLMFIFGIALVAVVLWKERTIFVKAVPMVIALAIGTHFITRTDQAGLLLYTSVAYLTPAHVKYAPGFENYVAPLQKRLLDEWQKFPYFAKVKERKEIGTMVNSYLESHPEFGTPHHDQDVNDFCRKLAKETCLRALPKLPMLAFYKFRNSSADASSSGFAQNTLTDRQMDAFTGDMRLTSALAKRLTGRELKTREEVEQWVRDHYVASGVEWFDRLHHYWHLATLSPRLHDWKHHGARLSGVSFFYLLAFAGILFSLFRRGALQWVYILWGLNVLGLFFVIMLTANVKPRFRFVFEPFWYLYILLLIDTIVVAVRGLLARRKSHAPLPA